MPGLFPAHQVYPVVRLAGKLQLQQRTKVGEMEAKSNICLKPATSQASKSDDDAYELRTRATYEQRSSVPRETPYKRVSRAKSALLLRFQTGDALLETQ